MKKTIMLICLIISAALTLAGCLDYSLMDEPAFSNAQEEEAPEETSSPEKPATPVPTLTPAPTPSPKPSATPEATPVPAMLIVTPSPTPEPSFIPLESFDPESAFMPDIDTRLYGLAIGMGADEAREIVGLPYLQEESDYPYGGMFLRSYYRFGWVDFVSSAEEPDNYHISHIEVSDPSFVGPRGISIGQSLYYAMYLLGYPEPEPGRDIVLYEDAEKTVSIIYFSQSSVQISIDFGGRICYFIVNIQDNMVCGYAIGQRID